jgi:hypothetical protein
MCVTLFIETNAGDLPTQEQDRKRRAHAARPGEIRTMTRVTHRGEA